MREIFMPHYFHACIFLHGQSPMNVAFLSASQSLSFIAVGDWGSGTTSQKRTASAMGKWAASHRARFIVSLGDNIYSTGVTSASDPQFNTKWKNIYTQSAIRSLPWYISTGNHDHGSSSTNDGREKYQVNPSLSILFLTCYPWMSVQASTGRLTVNRCRNY